MKEIISEINELMNDDSNVNIGIDKNTAVNILIIQQLKELNNNMDRIASATESISNSIDYYNDTIDSVVSNFNGLSFIRVACGRD